MKKYFLIPLVPIFVNVGYSENSEKVEIKEYRQYEFNDLLKESKNYYLGLRKEIDIYPEGYSFSEPEIVKLKENIKAYEIIQKDIFFRLKKYDLNDFVLLKLKNLEVNIEADFPILEEWLLCESVEDKKLLKAERSKNKHVLNENSVSLKLKFEELFSYLKNKEVDITPRKIVKPTVKETASNLQMIQKKLIELKEKYTKSETKSVLIITKEIEELKYLMNSLFIVNSNIELKSIVQKTSTSLNDYVLSINEYNEAMKEDASESEIRFLKNNINMNFSITYEYINKYTRIFENLNTKN